MTTIPLDLNTAYWFAEYHILTNTEYVKVFPNLSPKRKYYIFSPTEHV